MVYALKDDEIIMEVMDTAPSNWNTILSTQLYPDLVSFQSAIRYHEDALLEAGGEKKSFNRYDQRETWTRNKPTTFARAHLVGSSTDLPPPKFPKDDANISKRATPKDKGARGCRHCGSLNHWDKECKYAFKGMRNARTRLAEASMDLLEAEDEYEDLYYSVVRILRFPFR
ncbi:hypothetical protein K525DRAFT_213608 [Schizophyllum commune Loenen D]|nr:hypothetical protein K525DRAFT_213608 [Schizophyllum commune Loenen D]